MPRPIWNGSISFGLVNVPVKLFTAQSPKDVRFNQLHAPDNGRVRMKRFCEVENVEVPFDEIVKGYEIAPDQYVVIDPKELEEFDPKATHTIDIEEFVHLDQIDPIYFEKAYYLVPDERAGKPYRLLADALADADKVGIAKFVMRTKQYLCAIRVVDGVLVLSTMLYADEVVPASEMDIPDTDDIEVTEKELKMARSLVDSLTADEFEPEKFKDTYRERVVELIEQKAAGEVVVAPTAEAEPTKVVDLLAALEASVAAAKEAKKTKAAG
ncbi:MAG: end-binding protein Ku [Actinomycetota bacterium]|jgi:DNA end-binding protein Ku|nr:end-binding protein Ku [Actinomycetota bacterium]